MPPTSSQPCRETCKRGRLCLRSPLHTLSTRHPAALHGVAVVYHKLHRQRPLQSAATRATGYAVLEVNAVKVQSACVGPLHDASCTLALSAPTCAAVSVPDSLPTPQYAAGVKPSSAACRSAAPMLCLACDPMPAHEPQTVVVHPPAQSEPGHQLASVHHMRDDMLHQSESGSFAAGVFSSACCRPQRAKQARPA